MKKFSLTRNFFNSDDKLQTEIVMNSKLIIFKYWYTLGPGIRTSFKIVLVWSA